jgi:hypothetical protein
MLFHHLVSTTSIPGGGTPWPTGAAVNSMRLWDTGTLWGEIETSRGVYDWSVLDPWLNIAAANHADVLFTFGGTPTWAIPTNVAISSVSRNNNVVTVTTSAVHGLSYVSIYASNAQETVVLSGVSDSSFNGSYMITGTPTANTFTFAQSGSNGSSSGGSFSAQCSGPYGGGGCPEAPYSLTDFDDFVTALATHAGTKISHYEMWNEANLDEFWKGSKQTLVTMSQQARSIIKGINPNATIVSPSTAVMYDDTSQCEGGDARCGSTWMNSWLSMGGSSYIDEIAFHGYPFSMAATDPEDIVAQYNVERLATNNAGASSIPLWDTESSWCTMLSDQNQEAAYVGRHLILEASVGVQRNYWYAWDDTACGTLWLSSGITTPGIVYETLSTLLNGASYPSGCVQNGSTWTCAITLSNGTSAEAVWNMSTSQSFPVSPSFGHYTALTGQTAAVSNGTVTVSSIPIILTP